MIEDSQRNSVNEFLHSARQSVGIDLEAPSAEELYAGIDLGTSTIQVTLVDAEGDPRAVCLAEEDAVRDGIVLDYRRAVEALNELVGELGVEAGEVPAAVGYPPGTDARAQRNAAKDVGFTVIDEVPEPEAAQEVLGLGDGLIVDIGGGTTGITRIRNGERTRSTDVATGGHHVTLVLSGSRDLEYDQAEKIKENEPFSAYRGDVMPVLEKMVSIVQENLNSLPVDAPVVLVGGTTLPDGFEEPFADELDQPVWKPEDPLMVTPMGIALRARSRSRDQV